MCSRPKHRNEKKSWFRTLCDFVLGACLVLACLVQQAVLCWGWWCCLCAGGLAGCLAGRTAAAPAAASLWLAPHLGSKFAKRKSFRRDFFGFTLIYYFVSSSFRRPVAKMPGVRRHVKQRKTCAVDQGCKVECYTPKASVLVPIKAYQGKVAPCQWGESAVS